MIRVLKKMNSYKVFFNYLSLIGGGGGTGETFCHPRNPCTKVGPPHRPFKGGTKSFAWVFCLPLYKLRMDERSLLGGQHRKGSSCVHTKSMGLPAAPRLPAPSLGDAALCRRCWSTGPCLERKADSGRGPSVRAQCLSQWRRGHGILGGPSAGHSLSRCPAARIYGNCPKEPFWAFLTFWHLRPLPL